MKKIPAELWEELGTFLNRVADERNEDSDGPGSTPSGNADLARALMKKLGIERKKRAGII